LSEKTTNASSTITITQRKAAQQAVPADRFAREIVAILWSSCAALAAAERQVGRQPVLRDTTYIGDDTTGFADLRE